MPAKPLGGITPYFGSKRTLAPQIVSHLGPHQSYYEPFCFPAETPVYSDDGWKPISEIKEGDTVQTVKGRGTVGAVLRREYTGPLVTVSMKGDYRSVRCTPNHPVLCIRKEWQAKVKQKWWADGLRPTGMLGKPQAWLKPAGAAKSPPFRKLTIQRARAMYEKAEWVPAGELKPGDFVVYHFDSERPNIGTVQMPYARYGGVKRNRRTTFPVNLKTCRLIGLYIAEGCYDQNGVHFSFHKDETDYIEFVRGQMSSLFGSDGELIRRDDSNGVAIRFASRQAARFFKQFGHTAKNKHIPTWLKQLPMERQLQLVRGIFEGDGCLRDDGVELLTVSKRLADDVFDVLIQQGMMPTLRTGMVTTTLPASTRRHTSRVYRVCVWGQGRSRLAKSMGDTLGRSNQAKVGVNLMGVERPASGPAAIIRRVKSVTTSDFSGEVFNLTVAGHPSYLTQIGTVHNCGSLAALLAKPECQLEVVSEKNPMVENLIRCLADETLARCLFERVRNRLVSEGEFLRAADYLADESHLSPYFPDDPDVGVAEAFLLVSWQGPSGLAGTTRKPRFAVRNTTSGGSLAARWAAVAPAIPAWHERLRNVEFRCKDAFELLQSVPDQNGCVLYCDPPYFADSRTGGEYACDFTDAQHNELFIHLSLFRKTRVVVSYYDSPDANLLYEDWRKVPLSANRTMKNAVGGEQESVSAGEVLFINQPE